MPKSLDNKQALVIDAISIKKAASVSAFLKSFSIYGIYAIYKELSRAKSISIILEVPPTTQGFGQNVAQVPSTANYQTPSTASYQVPAQNAISSSTNEALAQVLNALSGDASELPMQNTLKSAFIAKECARLFTKKARVFSSPTPNMCFLYVAAPDQASTQDQASINNAPQATTEQETQAQESQTYAIINLNTLSLGSLGKVGISNAALATRLDGTEADFVPDTLAGATQSATDITAAILARLELFYAHNSPSHIYFSMLSHIFASYLNSDARLEEKALHLDRSAIFKSLYRFQREGVGGMIEKIERYNGCILADSVGLGKTYSALAIIRYYELQNLRVLVLTPKKLLENWRIYRSNEINNPLANDRFSYDLLTHSDLSRKSGLSATGLDLERLNYGAYGLIVIDESHNFRSGATKSEHSRYKKLFDRVINTGVKTRVLLLSATPVNNRMSDIENQIRLITENDDEALIAHGIPSIKATLKAAQKTFEAWQHLDERARTKERFIDMVDKGYFRLLDMLTIARSREHITSYYDLDEIGRFPHRLPPISRKIRLNPTEERGYELVSAAIHEVAKTGGVSERILQMVATKPHATKGTSIREIAERIADLPLASYSPLKYIDATRLEDYITHYKKENNTNRRPPMHGVASLMGIMLLKRLESSLVSFELTLSRVLIRCESEIAKIEAYKAASQKGAKKRGEKGTDKNSTKEVASLDTLLTELDDELGDTDGIHELGALEESESTGGKKLKVALKDMDLTRFLFDLTDDRDSLRKLLEDSRELLSLHGDRKLADLKRQISKKLASPINSLSALMPEVESEIDSTQSTQETTIKSPKIPNKKIIVFTAFSDTARYLYDALLELGLHTLLITGDGKNRASLTAPLNASPSLKSLMALKNTDGLLSLFSPRSKKLASLLGKEDLRAASALEFDLLVCTDCISEGQNLQDCDTLINYDVHWNPVRLIQRFGRIDRLGSENARIQMTTYWPDLDLDFYIDLESRLLTKSVMVDTASTMSDNILMPEDEEENGKGGGGKAKAKKARDFRLRQLEELQNNVIDLEKIRGGISITDLSFNDFKSDLLGMVNRLNASTRGDKALAERQAPNLLDFIKPPSPISNIFAAISLSHFAQATSSTTSENTALNSLQKGAIFALRYLGNAPLIESPLGHYYLVYINEKEEVLSGFLEAKHILDTIRTLCYNAPLDAKAARHFKEATHGYKDMGLYANLLEVAIESLYKDAKLAGLKSLFEIGPARLSSEVRDFEVIAWLVLID